MVNTIRLKNQDEVEIKESNKLRVITLCYIEILIQVVFWIWFLYPALYWEGNNIHAKFDLIKSFLGWFNSIGNQLTVDSYTTYHIFPVLSINNLVKQDGEPTAPHKLVTGTKPSVSNIYLLFCPCVVQKSTAHVDGKALNMLHQSQKGFQGILIGISQHQKWSLYLRT